MTSRGTVRSWDFGSESGVIDSVDTPGGCRATFWDLMVEGISVTDEDFGFHAVAVWPSRCDPPAEIPRGAYRGPGGAWVDIVA